MIINNITLENFRCYNGHNTISLNSGGKVTLIYGDSGAGKSSLLQFFRWMFYGDPDFGKDNDKPLFNLVAYRKIKQGQKIRVLGKIDFEHLGVRYCLTKSADFEYAINPMNAKPINQDLSLQVMSDDNWNHFSGDVSNKINTILPKGLSKYFLLDGEKARDIVLNSSDLQSAIHQLFGLDAYANAISHIGNKNKKNSVLGYYQNEITSKTKNVKPYKGMNLIELQEATQDLYDKIERLKDLRRETIEKIKALSDRRDEIFKTLGQSANKENIVELLKLNDIAIKDYGWKIQDYKIEAGDLFYQNFPYLFLSRTTSKSSAILREKNDAFASAASKNIFENLTKSLLKEILAKNVCVCGRDIDPETKDRIEKIMGGMPPDSYEYQFGQFVSSSRGRIASAQSNIFGYQAILEKINDCQQQIIKLEDLKKEKEDELKKLDSSKELVDELEQIDIEIKKLNSQKAGIEGEIAQDKLLFNEGSSQVSTLLKNSDIEAKYAPIIEFFEKILVALDQEKRKQEILVKSVLNDCVRDVFKKLTTQTELDADKIKFINDDFSLRTTYLTGGQLAVDEYSYVIGILKALQEMKMDNNENPIIIDAPFAFTGNIQSEHIFKTLPTISKQTVLLTLDLNKVRNFVLNNKDVYDFYIIKSDKAQESAVIERGNIDDIKF